MEHPESSSRTQRKRKEWPRKPKANPVNPIEAAITLWDASLPEGLLSALDLTLERLLSAAPKRWVAYSPMALLPSGSFQQEWDSLVKANDALIGSHRNALWKLVLSALSRREGKGVLTHLAINSGIPLNRDLKSEVPEENILRTPSGLIMLYGDFGPALSPTIQPTAKDFEEAFWVSTKQNGISQVWAPRYTMFSRGNVKEKARLLKFHGDEKGSNFLEMQPWTAVDLYAGIGYFVFSYLKMSMRVLGWELNPWSVEGLRRGAVANGWAVKVVGPEEKVEILPHDKLVVVCGDNRNAREMLRAVNIGEVLHVNCGLLPASTDSWETALSLVQGEGWLHLHENVGKDEVDARKLEIENLFNEWLRASSDKRLASIDHIEHVKTFAPGVWHIVFDVHLSVGVNLTLEDG